MGHFMWENQMRVFHRPGNSPNFNPIENSWINMNKY